MLTANKSPLAQNKHNARGLAGKASPGSSLFVPKRSQLEVTRTGQAGVRGNSAALQTAERVALSACVSARVLSRTGAVMQQGAWRSGCVAVCVSVLYYTWTSAVTSGFGEPLHGAMFPRILMGRFQALPAHCKGEQIAKQHHVRMALRLIALLTFALVMRVRGRRARTLGSPCGRGWAMQVVGEERFPHLQRRPVHPEDADGGLRS